MMVNLVSVITPAQITQTAELAKEIWIEHFTPIIGTAQIEYMLDTIQSAEAIADQIKNKGYTYFLIENNGQIVGYCAYVPQNDSIFLSKLYIRKSMRGKGLARKAIEYLRIIAAENNLSKITLTVNKNNIGPIAAYEKLGFVITGPIVQDIGNGFIMDDYKMQLCL